MMLVDSCGWIEFFASGNKSEEYAKYLLDYENIVTPSIVIYEVYKKVLRERGEEAAMMVAAQMNNTQVVELTAGLSLLAAGLSLKYDLPMADAIVYATAKTSNCQVVTSDKHFSSLEDVIII